MRIKVESTKDGGVRSAKDLASLFPDEPIDDEQLALGMHLSFRNALDLFDDAKVLAQRKKYARAFCLAVLSLEELAKPPLLTNAIFIDDNDRETWRAFWRMLRTHESKQGVWAAYGRGLRERGSHRAPLYQDAFAPGSIALLERFKQAGFYVTYFAREGFILPSKLATENRAWVRKLMAFVERRIRSFDDLHGTLSKSRLFVRTNRALAHNIPSDIRPRIVNTVRNFDKTPRKNS